MGNIVTQGPTDPSDDSGTPAMALMGGGQEEADSGDGAQAAPAEPEAAQPVVKSDWDKTPRNAPCPCGSGKKFKKCHGAPAGAQ